MEWAITVEWFRKIFTFFKSISELNLVIIIILWKQQLLLCPLPKTRMYYSDIVRTEEGGQRGYNTLNKVEAASSLLNSVAILPFSVYKTVGLKMFLSFIISNKPENPFQTMTSQYQFGPVKKLSPKNFSSVVVFKNEVFEKPDFCLKNRILVSGKQY